MAKRRKKPTDPAEIARREAHNRRNPATWGVNSDALNLPANADVVSEGATRKNETRSQRFDVFSRFYRDGSLARAGLEAVRRLQDDLSTLHRTDGASGSGVIVPMKPDGELATVLAGQRIEAARKYTGAHSWAILMAICEAPIVSGRQVDWRFAVESVSRERQPNAQGALVRAAAMNLADAYGMVMREKAA